MMFHKKISPLSSVLASGEFSHSKSGKNDQFWFKENSHILKALLTYMWVKSDMKVSDFVLFMRVF